MDTVMEVSLAIESKGNTEMKDNPKFSVVVPLYNKQYHIQKVLESVLRQSFTDFELIVVDDGSEDDSYERATRLVDDRLIVIQQKNQGVAVARNTGIYTAKGEYIAFLDADDYWDEDYLETIDGLTHRYKDSDIFVTAYRILLGENKVNHSKQIHPEEGCLDSYWKTLGEGYDFVWTSATVIRKSALLKAGCFTPGELVGQDLDMWARVARNNPRVAYSAKECVSYDRTAEQNARSRVKIAHSKAFIKDLEEELDNPDRSKEEKKAIQNKYDLKMTIYIFTCILAGEKKRAREELRKWKGKRTVKNVILINSLRISSVVPAFVNKGLFQLRLRVF